MANLKPKFSLNLDANQQKNFIKFFKSLGDKPATTVRLFDRSEYYTLHGDDAELAAKCVFKSLTHVKTMCPQPDGDELKYVVLSKTNFENFVRELLLVKNYRVEVFTNKKAGKTSAEFTLEFKGSPGNLMQFEELLYSNNDMVESTTIIALQLKVENQQRNVGVACVDVNEMKFSVSEFVDDDFFVELEAIVVLLGPKECILPTAEGDFARIKNVLERNGVMVTIKRKDFSFDQTDLVQDLNKLLHFKKDQQKTANTLPEISNLLAMSALGATIRYLELIGDNANYGNFKLELLNLNRFVHLDAAAVSALNIFPKPGTPMNSPSFKWQSILGVLDRCRTPQGHRLMAQWLKQPLRNQETIKDRLDIVECLVDGVSARAELHDDYLKRFPDIISLTKKLLRKKATLQDVYRLYQIVVRLPKILMVLASLENTTVQNVIYKPLKDLLKDLNMFKSMVEQVVDLEGIEKGEYFVQSSFDDNLKEYREQMNNIEEKCRTQLSKAAKDLNLDEGTTIKLDTVSHLGFHFRISLKDDAVLRKSTKYKTLDTIKAAVRFTTDRLTDLNTDYNEAKASFEEHQATIVEEVVRITVGYLIPLTSLNHQIAELDCLVSFAVAAATAPIPYVRPKIHAEGTGKLEMVQIRHPCLELQEDIAFIANDVKFAKGDTNMFIITGPNMGGKSTYIRSVGVAVLMAHVGSFVPCDSADISIVDSILGRIGANDNLTKGLSTFMVEMIETSGIIRIATENSLVIIDELGRGTSTYEGCGIAWAIAEHLATATKCFTLFATHFHEITELTNTATTVKNSHMVAFADNDNFTLLYQVKPGVMEKSFGIQVAKMANFPEQVVELAQKLYDESEDHLMKSNADGEGIGKLLAAEIESLTKMDNATEADINSVRDKIIAKIKESDSRSYFSEVFPDVF